jgi:hypothetical protein
MRAAAAERIAPSFKVALGDQLLVAHTRLRRRRRRRQVGLAIAAVLVVAFVSIASLPLFDSRSAAAEAISVSDNSDGSRVVTIERPDALPDVLQAEMAANNIRSIVIGQMTGPSRVGSIISARLDSEPSAHNVNIIRSMTIPAGFTGVVTLTVGQGAPAGAEYEQPTSPFDAGEPLAGFAKDHDPAAIAAAATKKGLHVTITGRDDNVIRTVAPGTKLVTAFMISSETLKIRVDA